VAFVGAGGKTAALQRLAREARGAGEPLILAVTTRLGADQVGIADRLFLRERGGEFSTGVHEIVLIAERPLPDQEKIAGVHPEYIAEVASKFPDVSIAVEADGARFAWLKVPGRDEPRIPPNVNTVVAVTAMPALGGPLAPAWIHRWEVMEARFSVQEGERLTPELMAGLLDHPEGSFKGTSPGAHRIWLINQADTHEQRTMAMRFCEEVLACGSMEDTVAVGSLKSGDDIHWIDRSEK